MERQGASTTWEGISELAARYDLLTPALGQLRTLAALLAGDPFAPTAVRDPTKVIDDHLADSLVAMSLAEVTSATTIADLGAGAGLPGLPLAIALPRAEVSLVESNAKKCAFIDRVIQVCALDNAASVPERVESWRAGIGRFDIVTARALAPLDVVAEYAAPLLRIGGSLVAWRGKRAPEEEVEAARAAQILGFSVLEPLKVVPYAGAQHRYLHVMSKVMSTPERFPRRPGMARKRPLGRGRGV